MFLSLISSSLFFLRGCLNMTSFDHSGKRIINSNKLLPNQWTNRKGFKNHMTLDLISPPINDKLIIHFVIISQVHAKSEFHLISRKFSFFFESVSKCFITFWIWIESNMKNCKHSSLSNSCHQNIKQPPRESWKTNFNNRSCNRENIFITSPGSQGIKFDFQWKLVACAIDQ